MKNFARLWSGLVLGMEGRPVMVEVDRAGGFFGISVVGLPDPVVRESRDRVVSALRQSGFDPPEGRVTVNLAPADLPKEGAVYDLAIAVGTLAACGEVNALAAQHIAFLGELSLDGILRGVRGVLPMCEALGKVGIRKVIVPPENADEAAFIPGMEVFPARNLKEVVDFFVNGNGLVAHRRPEMFQTSTTSIPDFSEVRGQAFAKRACEIAAAGRHHLLLIGPPGSGKTMLAKRLPGILPELSMEEVIEVARISSVAGFFLRAGIQAVRRPCRLPHHSVSYAGMVGGGNPPHPGEITLAHRGVLVLDEMAEFHRNVLEVLRQPLEERSIRIARSKISVQFPCDFMMVATTNPCPCGFAGDHVRPCRCRPVERRSYLKKLSGPLIDRIDLVVFVERLAIDELVDRSPAEPSSTIRERVKRARRFREESGTSTHFSSKAETLLRDAASRLGLTARSTDAVRRVAQTIADLAESDAIEIHHVAEAIQFQPREMW